MSRDVLEQRVRDEDVSHGERSAVASPRQGALGAVMKESAQDYPIGVDGSWSLSRLPWPSNAGSPSGDHVTSSRPPSYTARPRDRCCTRTSTTRHFQHTPHTQIFLYSILIYHISHGEVPHEGRL